ncbi:MAG: hypothetical protein CSA11_12315, partial [Chloroflexi bacterium]
MSNPRLTSLRDEYIQSLKVRNLARRTIEARAFMLEKFFDYLKSRHITEISVISKGIILDYQIELYQTI